MKNTLIAFIVGAVVALGLGFVLFKSSIINVDMGKKEVTETPTTQTQETTTTPTETKTEPEVVKDTTPKEGKEVIGSSAGEHDITAYHYGTGKTEVLFVGGIHGGYEWNTSLVGFELMDYLDSNPDAIPKDVRVTVIPVLNPDGLMKVLGTTDKFSASDVKVSLAASIPGRVNENGVDLNRNFDCDWNAEGVWQNTKVSGGGKAFSEPESQAIRDYVNDHKPAAVITWYSAAGGVYASNCHNGVLPETTALTNLYAKASGYPAHESFDYYEITGDMMNWLAKEGIPAVSVLLTNHTDVEWSKNLKGIQAVLSHYSE